MKELDRRVQHWLWSDDAGRSAWECRGMAAARLAYALGRDVIAGELSLRAMSLVYTTILAVVPLLAFSFAVLKGLGFHRELEPLLMQFLEPLDERAAEVSRTIIASVDNVSSSGLATASLVLLVLTSLSMAQKVETSFNFVWRVDRPRSFARRASEYLSFLLVGPLLMSVTLGLIAAVSSTAAMSRLRAFEPVGAWLASLGALTPYALVILAFWLLYLFIPNTKVRARPALIGAFFGGLVWAGSGDLFTQLVVDASRYDAIYSGFAIVIITMLWLYLSWLILLLGAQLAFYRQNPHALRYGQRTLRMSNGLSERLAFEVMLLVGRDFHMHGHGWTVEGLAARMRVPRHLLEPVVGALMHERLLAETKESSLIPGKDLHSIGLTEIASAVRGHGFNRASHEWRTVQMLVDRIEQAFKGALGAETLADLIAADQQAEADAKARAEGDSSRKPRGEIPFGAARRAADRD